MWCLHRDEEKLLTLFQPESSVDYDSLWGDKVQALVRHLRAQGRLNELLAKLRMEALYATLPVSKSSEGAQANLESVSTHIFSDHLGQLIATLEDSNPDRRWQITYALGKTPAPRLRRGAGERKAVHVSVTQGQ